MQTVNSSYFSFDNFSLANEPSDSKRSSPSLLARQLRLRLIAAEDSDVPRNLSNIVVSIHAIATFQALHDYLRPRVSGLLSSSSRLSGMLAALAASGLAPSAASRALAGDSLFSGGTVAAAAREAATASSSFPDANTGVHRRRSLRLSAKKSANSVNADASEDDAAVNDANEASEAVPAASKVSDTQLSPSMPDNASAETVLDEPDAEFAADFTDDEVDVDAEVIYLESIFRSKIHVVARYSKKNRIQITLCPRKLLWYRSEKVS